MRCLFQTAFVRFTYFHSVCFTAKSMLFSATSMSRSGGRLRCHASLITTWLNFRSCEFCVYHSCPLVVSSLNQISCDFLLTCLKNSSRREVVQRWWRSQLLAGWLMSAVCSSRDRALGLSMLQETNVFSCSQMYNYLIMLNKNKMKHLFIYLFSPSPPKSGSRIWCPDPSGTRLLGGGTKKKNNWEENERTFPRDVAQVHVHKKTESISEVREGDLCTESDIVLWLGCLWADQ